MSRLVITPDDAVGCFPVEDEPTPTMIGQGNLCERRTRREEIGVGGSVAGWESVWGGIAEWVVRSRTVRAEGVNVISYVIGEGYR